MDIFFIFACVCAAFVCEMGMIFWILWDKYKDAELYE